MSEVSKVVFVAVYRVVLLMSVVSKVSSFIYTALYEQKIKGYVKETQNTQ